jgi:hypothetical protein
MRRAIAGILALSTLVGSVWFVPDASAVGTSIALDPSVIVIDPGQEFEVGVVLPGAGDPVNGYDAIVGFDPSRLELILPPRPSSAEGPLFIDACPQRFLDVRVATDSTSVSIAHVILCAGTSVTGPGELYRLRFRARTQTGTTWLRLLGGSAAYQAGAYVEPLTTSDCQVVIGEATANVPAPGRSRFFATPNPFNPSTELVFRSAAPQRISIEMFDSAGRALCTVYEGQTPTGDFRIAWDGRDRRGRILASGVYFARLRGSSGVRLTTRLVLVR